MRVHVKADRCQGHTLCAMKAPEVFQLGDEDGHSSAPEPHVPEHLQDAVRAAAATCPELAISVDEDD
ncbi:ferredoxin [Nocardia sp. BSTN01]|nr:ferredoxin [Nocardia sp. BSTN01]MBF4997368.1 ferredoxin [Nocardia sp. BSTN01]